MKSLRGILLAVIVFFFTPPCFAQDAVPFNSITLNTVQEIHDWPVTTSISALSTNAQGLDVHFSKRDTADWPDVIPAGWSGPVYYTVWLGTRVSDGVHLAASLNVYRGQAGSGAGDVTNLAQYGKNLWYLDSALKAVTVKEGDTLYLMVTAGGERGIEALTVKERSNVVAFTASSVARTFDYAAQPVPTPVPVPDPIPVPPVVDLGPLLARLTTLEGRVTLGESVRDDLIRILNGRLDVLEARKIPTACRASVFGIGVSCALQ